jgi:hypothetical protein
MLKLFRTIRKKLIEQHNVRKYLLYAIGEILLVVIGILIALQVNTWNENRKAKIIEKTLLETLLKDINDSYQVGLNYFKIDSLNVKYLSDFITSGQKRDSLLIREDGELIIMRGLWSLEFRTPVIQVFEDLKNSGTSATITNQEIRIKLADINAQIDRIKSQNEDRMYIQRTYLDPFILNDFEFSGFALHQSGINNSFKTATDYNSFISDKGILNKLSAKVYIGERTLNMRTDLQNQMKDLISEIEREIIRQ